MPELIFTPRIVSEVEQKLNLSLTRIMLAGPSVTNTLVFLQKGLKVTPDMAEKEMQKIFDSGIDLITLFSKIMDQLADLGFLQKSQNLGETQQETPASNLMPGSEIIGEVASLQQSELV